MSKDYAKNRQNRNKRKKTAAKAAMPRWLWLFMGLLFGLLITKFDFFKDLTVSLLNTKSRSLVLNTHKHGKPTSSHAKVDSEQTAVPSEDKMKFDFYTVLPKMHVNTPGDEVVSAGEPEVNKSMQVKALSEAEQRMLSPKLSPKPTAAAAEPKPKTKLAQQTDKPTQEGNNSTAAAIDAAEKLLAKQGLKDTNLAKNKSMAATTNAKYMVQLGSFKHFEEADELKAKLAMIGIEANIKSAINGTTTWKRVWVGPFVSLEEANQAHHRLVENHVQGIVTKYN